MEELKKLHRLPTKGMLLVLKGRIRRHEMFNMRIYGFQIEGRSLCVICAEKIYGKSLEMDRDISDVMIFDDSDQPTYAHKGLLCDDCLKWIVLPQDTEDRWWLVDPEPQEQLRLLAPFADFLETLQIDVMNLRNITTR